MAVDSQAVRKSLGYPVVDIDGHLVEHVPEVAPFVREYLPRPLFDRWIGGEFAHLFGVTGATNAERSRTRVPQAGWWGAPTANTVESPRKTEIAAPNLSLALALGSLIVFSNWPAKSNM